MEQPSKDKFLLFLSVTPLESCLCCSLRSTVILISVFDILVSLYLLAWETRLGMLGWSAWAYTTNISLIALPYAVLCLRGLNSNEVSQVREYSMYKQVELVAKAANLFLFFLVYGTLEHAGTLFMMAVNLAVNAGLTLLVWSYETQMHHNSDILLQYLRVASASKSSILRPEFSFSIPPNP